MQTNNPFKHTKIDFLLDLFTFLLHIVISVSLAVLAFLLQAPFFGAAPDPREQILSFFFFLCAFSIGMVDIFLLSTGRFKLYLVIFGVTLASAILWSVFISPYDMSKLIIGYLVLAIPLLCMKYPPRF